jgi:hypothetical protein
MLAQADQATGESVGRYFSTKEFNLKGVNKVFRPNAVIPEN